MDRKLDKNTRFWPRNWKKDLQNATPHSLLDHFTWKFAQRYFARLQKTWPERIFEFLLCFAIYSASKFKKIAKIAIFAGFCAINSAKMKNKKLKILLCSSFWTIERYLCANFQVKWSSGEWGVLFWRSFFQFSVQDTVFLCSL